MKHSSIKMNFIYNVIYQVLLVLLPLITSPYISRVLSDDGLGVYSFQYTIANCFALVGMLGVNNYGNRSIAAVRDDRRKKSHTFWSIWVLQLTTSLVSLIVYIVYLAIVCRQDHLQTALALFFAVLASVVDINWFFFGIERFKLTVTRNIIIKLMSVACIFLFVKEKQDVWIYSLIIAGSLLLSNLAVWPFLKREIDICKISLKDMARHFPQMLVLFVPIIAVTLYNKMDKVMIGSFSTMSQSGFYENAEKIINIPTGIITAIGIVMLPRMSYLFANKYDESARRYFNVSLEFATAMSCGLACGISAIATEFAPLFFGESFTGINILIIALSPKIIFLSIANVMRTQYLIPLHKDRVFLNSVWLGAVVNVVINALLIPGFGALGAVLGTDAAEFIVMAYQVVAVERDMQIIKKLVRNLYYLMAASIMFVIVFWSSQYLGHGILGIILQIILGMVVYMTLCFPFCWHRYKHEIKYI